jgi:tetratricopeptide (TPR) repeat protein
MPQSVLSDECFQKGKKCFEIGEFEKAEILFQKFCDIRPDLEYGYIFLAASLDNLKRHDEAIITYDKALKINSENINTIKMQAYALYYVGRFIEACDNFEKILKNNNNADLYFGVGCCYYKQGNLIEAIEKFNMALKQNINHTPSWLNMGYCYYELLDFNKTINCYNAAIKLQPSLSIALFYSALAHCNLGSENFKEAVELFKSSALNAPDDSDIKNEAICCITKLSNDLSGSWLKNFL